MTDKAKHTAAVSTLEHLGYTYCDGEQWKPPLGKAPDFWLIDTLRTRIAELEAEQQAAPKAPPTPHLLATDNKGMRVDYSGLLGQSRRALQSREPANAEMLRQLQGHMQELGRRWYAGDTVAVDEFLQLYCIEHEARAALAVNGGK